MACAVVTGGARAWSPCGICRQVLYEFAADMPIALVAERDAPPARARKSATKAKPAAKLARRDTTLAALLPDGFLLKRRT